MPATDLERRITAPGERPEGEGWKCIHSSASPDGTRWWLWQRITTREEN